MDESNMNDRQWNELGAGESGEVDSLDVYSLDNDNLRLDGLFHAYRSACPDPEPSVNFMPELWAKIEAREASSTVFSRFAKALVTAALGASVVMGLLSASYSQPATPPSSYEGSYVQALAADHVSDLEPLQVERISELDQQ